MAKTNNIHYVNNADFSAAVVEHCAKVKAAREASQQLPRVSNYIASCFLKICEGLSHRDNFIRYPFREEMVMDAVENCLRAIENFNVDAATRTGKVNAFSYFTQIAWFAFVRRITKEKHQQNIKLKYIQETGIESLIADVDDPAIAQALRSYVDDLRSKIDANQPAVTEAPEVKVKPQRGRKKKAVDSDLQDFME
jgi:hypothetical protein